MTESNWQGDMLRRLAEQSPAEDPDRPQTPPAAIPAAPPQGGQGTPVQQQYQQQYPEQPPPQYQQQPPQQGYQQQPPPAQQFQQQPPPQQQYDQQYPQQPYQQQPPPPQYQQQPPPPQYQQPYPPDPYQQQQPPPPQYQQQPPPPQYQQPPPAQQYPQQPPPPPQYQQYPPQQYYPPQYEQQNPPAYQGPQLDGQYPPQGQHHPGQVPYQDYYDQPPQTDTGGSWSTPPTPQSDQIGTPLQEPEGDSVFRRFRRLASEAAYLLDASGRMQRDVENISTIRRPIAIMRRVGVLSPVTNAGTSTVTALLSTILSVQRADRVVAIDADPSGAELSRRLERSLGAGPVEGVTLVRSEGTAEALRNTLVDVQGQGARDVGLAIVDCPGSMYDEIGSEMALSGHCVVLVVPSVQQVAEYCLQQLDQLPPSGQDVLLQRGVVVISLVQNVDPGSVDWLADAFRNRGLDPVVLPYDAHIATAWPLQSDKLQSETRQALLELAARVVGTVTRTPS